MKKILTGLIVLISCFKLYAKNVDKKGNDRPAIWRSSQTCVAESFVMLSTEGIHLHAISVDSPTLNIAAASYVAIFNSTTTPFTGGAQIFSTGTFLSTNVNSTAGGLQPTSQFVYDTWFTSGAVINKQGNACISIMWDFINTSYAYGAQMVTPWRP